MVLVFIRSASLLMSTTIYVFVEKLEKYLPDTHSYLDLCIYKTLFLSIYVLKIATRVSLEITKITGASLFSKLFFLRLLFW